MIHFFGTGGKTHIEPPTNHRMRDETIMSWALVSNLECYECNVLLYYALWNISIIVIININVTSMSGTCADHHRSSMSRSWIMTIKTSPLKNHQHGMILTSERWKISWLAWLKSSQVGSQLGGEITHKRKKKWVHFPLWGFHVFFSLKLFGYVGHCRTMRVWIQMGQTSNWMVSTCYYTLYYMLPLLTPARDPKQ